MLDGLSSRVEITEGRITELQGQNNLVNDQHKENRLNNNNNHDDNNKPPGSVG